MKVTKSAIGSEPEYPWINSSDFIRYMDESKRLDLLLGDYKSLEDLGPVLKTFWSRFQKMSPNHDVFKQSKAGKIDLSRTLPYYIHADEGRTLKKKAIFLLQWQVAFGKGVGQRLSAEEVQQKVKDLKLRPNFNGHAYTTRFLAATMLRSDYSNSPEMLEGLLELIVQDLASLGWQGIQLSVGHLWMVALGNKGDWSYLVDIANLTRSYRNCPKQASSKQPDKGICHLCYAGFEGYPYEDVPLTLFCSGRDFPSIPDRKF